jgi:hypothetical protein
MKSKYMVCVYRRYNDCTTDDGWEATYQGRSLIRAVLAFVWATGTNKLARLDYTRGL